jgi:hypothetical protein
MNGPEQGPLLGLTDAATAVTAAKSVGTLVNDHQAVV